MSDLVVLSKFRYHSRAEVTKDGEKKKEKEYPKLESSTRYNSTQIRVSKVNTVK